MKNNIKMIVIVILGIIVLYIFQQKNNDYNLNRTISACIVAQKKLSTTSFDPDIARKYCEEEIKKQLK